MNQRTMLSLAMVLAAAILLSACQSTYYAVWEKLGKEKRHLLRDQIENAKDDQKEASKEFKDALTRLKEMYRFDGGELDTMYEQLSDEYETCRSRADSVDERIKKVQRIANDLFDEWKEEIKQIKNSSFRAKSSSKLRQTQNRYARLERAMMASRKRMTPVLENMNDYVLYLKHNLNAQAVGALKSEVAGIESDVGELIKDINASIREADSFLAQFEK